MEERGWGGLSKEGQIYISVKNLGGLDYIIVHFYPSKGGQIYISVKNLGGIGFIIVHFYPSIVAKYE